MTGTTTSGAPKAGDRPGPTVSLPTARLAFALALIGAPITGAAWAVGRAVDPAIAGHAMLGGAGAVAAFAVGVLALRPWAARDPIGWVHAWMATLGACFLATVAAVGGLLYSVAPHGRAALGISAAIGHLVLIVSFSIVVAAVLRERLAAAGEADSP